MDHYKRELLQDAVINSCSINNQQNAESSATTSTDLICDDLDKQQSVHGSDVKHVFHIL